MTASLPVAPLALGILSGGLDSLLAVRLVRELGVRVVGYHFISPFFDGAWLGREEERAHELSARCAVEVRVESVWPEYLDVVRNPRHGRGKNLNPCLDCKIFMLNRARKRMRAEGASFVFTGEVLGQRPMSQRRDALHVIENESGLKGRLLRPLSALLLPPTIPEQEGLIDRSRLLDIRGRGRTRQMELAAQWGITDYPTPAGGCLLTDAGYSARLGDLLASPGPISLTEVMLLSAGRHFMVGGGRLVVGRNERDNERLEALAGPGDLLLVTPDTPGPTGLLRGVAGSEDILLAARIIARYGDRTKASLVRVALSRDGISAGQLEVPPADPAEVEPLRIITDGHPRRPGGSENSPSI